MSALPHQSHLYRDYLALGENEASTPALRAWYGAAAGTTEWMGREVGIGPEAQTALADALDAQAREFGAGAATLENIARLRNGARAVVSGQQVGLFGGPLLTLLKAATAVARAREASAVTGVEHVPVFWLASEDHDLPEVDHVDLPAKHALERLRAGGGWAGVAALAGSVPLPACTEALLERASELMNFAPVTDLLRECYGAGHDAQPTYGGAFARLLTRLFADHGLIVLDAAGRDFHRLGAGVLRAAVERAEELEAALTTRGAELERAGYHVQVLVNPLSSLLFLLSEDQAHPGVWNRQALRRTIDGGWKAGTRAYTTAQLLAILDAEPERLSPNALLRPVFQDAVLPTAAYIGGPAEIAYFAQSAMVYERILGRITPVLPRFSATLIDPAMASVMARHELTLGDLFAAGTLDALTHRLGARAMPIEGKRRLAAVGNAMDTELGALTSYMESVNPDLGRAAGVSASKMRYQMNRLRSMAARFEVQKEASLRRHAEALMLHLFPAGHPQERVLGGVWFVAQHEKLIDILVKEAGEMCLGHAVVRL